MNYSNSNAQYVTLSNTLTKVLPILLLIFGVVMIASDQPDSAEARPAEISWKTDPVRWMPAYVVTGASNENDNNGGHDVWYWFNFDRVGSMSSPYWNDWDHQGTLEIGWKDTGHQSCNDPSNTMKRNWPDNSRVRVDSTEDNTDAVIWISDLPKLRQDQTQNPEREYFLAYDCENKVSLSPDQDDFFGFFDENPSLSAQLGHWRWRSNLPISTYSKRTETLIPAEQGHKGIPAKADLRWIQTNVDLPWTRNWDMEQNRDWWSWRADLVHICGGGFHGDCYYHVRAEQDANDSRIGQTFKVNSITTKGEVTAGANTNYTVSVRFRCPVWGPNKHHAGDTACRPKIGLKPKGAPWDQMVWKTVVVPNDWTWDLYQTPVSFDWPAHLDDDEIEIQIDTEGYQMDVDAVWVSSGL